MTQHIKNFVEEEKCFCQREIKVVVNAEYYVVRKLVIYSPRIVK
jgi:hypothetical protein